jgi:DNA-binding transcriptional LysR family regulator
MSVNKLRSIETFLKAVEHGSLRKAAQAQGITPQAASHALAQLEQELGVRLMNRTTRHIALTQEGQQFLEATQPVLAALDRAVERVRTAKDEIAGPLSIVGPRTIFLPVLWPLMDEFCRRHPAVQPDINLDDRIANWVTDRVDVGFRIARAPEEGLIVRKLFPLQLITCASPEYLAVHGAPRSLDELVFHRCSVFRHGGNGRALPWYAKVDGEIVSRDIPPAISTNIAELEVEAALAGQVIAQLTCVSAAAHIRAGRLVPLLTQHVTDDVAIYLYYGSRSAQPARVRAFIDLAIERLAGGAPYVLSSKELLAAETKALKALPQAARTKPVKAVAGRA